jgi:hypothetical protein
MVVDRNNNREKMFTLGQLLVVYKSVISRVVACILQMQPNFPLAGTTWYHKHYYAPSAKGSRMATSWPTSGGRFPCYCIRCFASHTTSIWDMYNAGTLDPQIPHEELALSNWCMLFIYHRYHINK